MARSILILTEPEDLHAYAVAEGLRRKGAEVVLWHTSDFPTRCDESILFEETRQEVRILGQGVDLALSSLNSIDVVWRRRPSYVLESEALHPADRKFADYECNFFRRGLFDLLSSTSWWVNSPAAALRADSKPLQHATALRAGLRVPDTLYGNDPLQIRRFIQRNGGTVAYKPFRGQTWVNGGVSWAPYTALLTEEALVSAELLRLTPGIYQALVPKAYELRVTFIGSCGFRRSRPPIPT